MERPRDDRTTHGYPEIWRVELVQTLVTGSAAQARRVDFKGGGGLQAWQQYQPTQQQVIYVWDSLRRFAGHPGDRFWALYKHDSRRFELVSPAGTGGDSDDPIPRIVRFELISTLQRGGSASAFVVGWSNLLQQYTSLTSDIILVNDFSKVVPTSLAAPTHGIAVELTDRQGVYEILEIERATTQQGMVLQRFELTENLPLGGAADANPVIWTGVLYGAGVVGFQVRDFTGRRWQGKTGYRGWAVEPPDRMGQYEIVELEHTAEELEVTLDEDVSASESQWLSAGCTIDEYFRGVHPDGVGVPGTFVRVFDGHRAFLNYKSGAKAKATWNDQALDDNGQHKVGRYEFVWIEPPARWAWGRVKSSFTKSNAFATVEIVKTWDGVAHAE
jgi:hypothetical protein